MRAALKYISFGSLALLAAVLVAGTLLERCAGVVIYSSPLFVALWAVMLVAALMYIFVKKVAASLLLHVAFAVVLVGAFVTYTTAERGSLFLSKGAVPSSMFECSDGGLAKLPFSVSLTGCGVEFCADGVTPRDYFAEILVEQPGGASEAARLSMNRVCDRGGYRLFLSGVDGDNATLLVNHDEWGTAITYTGYLLAVLGFLSLFFARNSLRSALVQRLAARRAGAATALPRTNWLLVSLFSFVPLAVITYNGVCRWVETAVFPVSNGAEAMMFIAWCLLLAVLFLRKNSKLALGTLCLAAICGAAAFLSGISTPGPVQPILRTPLLPLHVITIIISYALIGLLAVNALVSLCLYGIKRNSERLEAAAVYGRVMLYFAVAFLVAGIFLGAVWGNISWGRYWGWDPKEVWALITLIICSFGFHTRSLPFMARPLVFHCFCIVAFVAVLFTYLGVNYLLGGLHSYA
jgi:ABC-type transport system involved in cytochrome c biogenesis permease subunit